MYTYTKIQYMEAYVRTEPAAIGLDSSVRQLLGLELVADELSLAVALWADLVHLEAAHGGRATLLFVLPICTVRVQGVLRLPGNVDFSFCLLRHLRGGRRRSCMAARGVVCKTPRVGFQRED